MYLRDRGRRIRSLRSFLPHSESNLSYLRPWVFVVVSLFCVFALIIHKILSSTNPYLLLSAVLSTGPGVPETGTIASPPQLNHNPAGSESQRVMDVDTNGLALLEAWLPRSPSYRTTSCLRRLRSCQGSLCVRLHPWLCQTTAVLRERLSWCSPPPAMR